MEQKNIDYANNQVAYMISQRRYLIAILVLSSIATLGFFIRMASGIEWISTAGLIICFGGAAILSLRVHKQAAPPSSDDLMD